MSLTPGSRLGPYEVIAKLGEGGMGEVYRARDSQLGRDVAIKCLPETFASDPDRLMRFEREARTLASLNHIHIAQVYGLEGGPVRALVMELVEGEDLSQRIARGPIPVDEAIAIARQITAALEAAHNVGIIHRDLKPANIKVRSDGTVKVLDFGLAKGAGGAGRASGAGEEILNSPTMTSPAVTSAGIILGTASYMSPEQARGKDVDHRSDIWAFGCVLYEMLTGRVVFAGHSVVETLGEVLKSTPDWSRLPADTPPAVRRLLRRTLAKDPSQRLQHIADARLDLDDAVSSSETLAQGPPQTRHWKIAAAAGIAIGVLGLAYALFSTIDRTDPTSASIKRFNIAAPEGTDGVISATMAPSGQQIAIMAPVGENIGLFVRSIGSVDPRRVVQLTPTPRAKAFWSPDEQSLAYFEGGLLKVVNIATGETRIVCDAPSPHGGTWGPGDTILFTPNESGGVYRVSARGGTPAALTTPAEGEESHRYPQFLADGRHFVFLGWTAKKTAGRIKFNLRLASLDRPGSTLITQTSSAASVDAQNHLLFAIDTPPRLAAATLDLQTGQLAAEPITIAEDLIYDWMSGAPSATAGRDDSLVYLNRRFAETTLTWMDRSGHEQGTVGGRGIYFDPTISPDGNSVLVERGDPSTAAGDIVRFELASGTLSRLTRDAGFENVPVWSPDGNRIVYSWDRDGISHLFALNADGSGAAEKIYGEPGRMVYAMDWSRDGRSLLFLSREDDGAMKIWTLSMADRQARRLFTGTSADAYAAFSPDGKWLAYASTESGTWEVYVCAWPSLAGRRRVSVGGGTQPQWRGDGRELFYLASDRIMSATISPSGSNLQIAAPVMLFATDLNPVDGLRNRFTVTRDGQRFLVLKPVVSRKQSPMTVIVNWTGLLKSSSP